MHDISTLPSLPEQPNIEFRHLPGWPAYAVGDDGSVWSAFGRGGNRHRITDKWTRLVSRPTRFGYHKLTLCPGRRTVQVHKLVLEAFVGPCPPGMQACHFPNRDRADNRLCNLRWDTPTNNQADRIVHGTEDRGSKRYNARFTDDHVRSIRERHAAGELTSALAAEYSVNYHTIHKIVKRINWKHVA